MSLFLSLNILIFLRISSSCFFLYYCVSEVKNVDLLMPKFGLFFRFTLVCFLLLLSHVFFLFFSVSPQYSSSYSSCSSSCSSLHSAKRMESSCGTSISISKSGSSKKREISACVNDSFLLDLSEEF